MLLRRGKLFPLAVDRSTARVKDEVKDDLAHTVLGTLLKRADGPQHVDVRVEGRLAHGAPDAIWAAWCESASGSRFSKPRRTPT